MKEEFKKKEMSEKINMLLESSCKDFKGIKTAYAEACAELRSKFEYTDRIIEYNNCIAAYETELAFEQESRIILITLITRIRYYLMIITVFSKI